MLVENLTNEKIPEFRCASSGMTEADGRLVITE